MISSAAFDFLCYATARCQQDSGTSSPQELLGRLRGEPHDSRAGLSLNQHQQQHIVSPLGAASHPPPEMQKLLCINSFTPPDSPTQMCPSCCMLSSVGKPYASYAGKIPEGYAEANLPLRKTPTQQDTLLILQ